GICLKYIQFCILHVNCLIYRQRPAYGQACQVYSLRRCDMAPLSGDSGYRDDTKRWSVNKIK
ncbi:hypothetical protein CKQ90_05945, partial [Klebsiella pneumoniae]